jgi:ubiquitin-like protein Pup
MAERELKKKQQQTTERTNEVVEEVPASSVAGEKLKAEIDEVLEDNAEEFVRNYVQKGGE